MPPSTEHANDDAVNAALAILDEPLPGPHAFVSYEVRSCLLLVGSTRPVLELAKSLRHHFEVVAAINGPRSESRVLGVSIVYAQRVSLTGHLGKYFATAHDGDGHAVDLAGKSSNDDGCFDLVLDLSSSPIIDFPLPPFGYFRPGDPSQNQAALDALPALSGEVRKPKYFNFEADRCAHRSQQVQGCDRCLDVCPAGAISSASTSITVDAYLCRGCGTCTAICPTGALTYADPPLLAIINRLEKMLQAYRNARGTHPWIGFHAGDYGFMEDWCITRDITLLPFAVRSVASLGLEVWLAAIALGASGVILLIPDSTPAMVVKVLTGQIGLANKLLEGIEHAQNKIFMLRGDQSDQDLTVVVEPDDVAIDKSWSYLMTNLDPRARLLALLEQLSSEPQLQPEVGGNTIELPTWATFGGVSIDSDTCTMCLACASLCPTGALRAHHVGAELGFIEAVCIQCGLCEHGCPEGAIKRQPRFNYQNLRSDNMVTLNRAEMANCTQCGQAFMPTALLASALKRLTGNSVEIEHAKQMLKVCPQCRANSALQAQFPEIHGNRK